jgi:hypothetical protein
MRRVLGLLIGLVALIAENEPAISYPVIIHYRLKAISCDMIGFECVDVCNFPVDIQRAYSRFDKFFVLLPLSK